MANTNSTETPMDQGKITELQKRGAILVDAIDAGENLNEPGWAKEADQFLSEAVAEIAATEAPPGEQTPPGLVGLALWIYDCLEPEKQAEMMATVRQMSEKKIH